MGYMIGIFSSKSLFGCFQSGFPPQPELGVPCMLSVSYYPLPQHALPLVASEVKTSYWVIDRVGHLTSLSYVQPVIEFTQSLKECECASRGVFNPMVLRFSLSLEIAISFLSQGQNCIHFHM